MLETLGNLDTTLFHFINGTLANPVTDLVMPVVTNDWFLRVLYAVAMVLILWKGDRRLRWLVLFSAITIAFTDQISSVWLKHLFARPRPCHTILDMHLLVNCGAGYSMPSSHAANAFGQAALFGLSYGRWRWHLFGFAAIVAISRTFVGVHYPFDILVGMVVGSLVGVAVLFAYEQAMRMLPPREV
ncbi:MAG: phosphatase PAP2 family protein [Candidatus Zixiibacteriota bacterium]